jgi:hypothetical protein
VLKPDYAHRELPRQPSGSKSAIDAMLRQSRSTKRYAIFCRTMPVVPEPPTIMTSAKGKEEMKRTVLNPASHPARSGRGTRRIMWAGCLTVVSLCCATAAPQQDQATLYFFNTSGWKAIPEKLTVLDNGKNIAAMNREQYVVLSIAPGHHVLRPKDERPPRGSSKHEVDLDAEPGVTYYVAGGFSPKMYFFRWTFAEIPKYEADKLLAEMKPQAQK